MVISVTQKAERKEGVGDNENTGRPASDRLKAQSAEKPPVMYQTGARPM